MNHSSDGINLHSLLLESNYEIHPLTVYGRYEFVQKDARELQLAQYQENLVFNVNVFTIGLAKKIFSKMNTGVSMGLQGTVYFIGAELETVYGNPLSAEVFLRVGSK
jgi:hypothetical protein